MLRILIFLLIAFKVQSVEAKPCRSVEFLILDAWTKSKLKGNKVKITDSDQQVLLDSVVDASFSYCFPVKKKVRFHIEVSNSGPYYKELIDYDPEINEHEFCTVMLKPSKNYFDGLLKEEDELYGKEGDVQILEFMDTSQHKIVLAHYQNGTEDLMRYIVNKINYPQSAIENGEQGKVFVSFNIEKNGKLSHIRITKGVSPALDMEALRVIKSFDRWTPGQLDGEIVRTKAILPINFSLK